MEEEYKNDIISDTVYNENNVNDRSDMNTIHTLSLVDWPVDLYHV